MAGQVDGRGYPHQGQYSPQFQRSHHHSRPRPDSRSRARREPRELRDEDCNPARSYEHCSFAHSQRRRQRPLQAFVEDVAEAAAREHEPQSAPLSAQEENELPKYRGQPDQLPILISVPEFNPERRYVLLSEPSSSPKTGTVAPSPASATAAATATANSPTGDSANATSRAAAATSSTPSATATSSTARHRSRSADRNSEYEANTCRKFTVPRIDAEAVTSRPSTSSGATTTAAATAAEASKSHPQQPDLQRRRSRADLPRIDTDIHTDARPSKHTDVRVGGSASPHRPRSATVADYKSNDHHRRPDHDRAERYSSTFLSPTVTKHATTGRDRTYIDYGNSKSDANGRPRSGGSRPGQDNRRLHEGRDRNTGSAHPSPRRRSNSFSEKEKPGRKPSVKRSSRDTPASARTSRNSTSPSAKGRRPDFPSAHFGRRDSISRDRDRDLDLDWERERERARGRERARDRPYAQSHDRGIYWEHDKDQEHEIRDHSRKSGRHDSFHNRGGSSGLHSFHNRGESAVLTDEELSSDGKIKDSSRRHADRSVTTPKERNTAETNGSGGGSHRLSAVATTAAAVAAATAATASLTAATLSGAAPKSTTNANASASGSSTHARHSSTIPISNLPLQSEKNSPSVTGTFPSEPFDPIPASPPKTLLDGRRRRENRRRDSSSSRSPSPSSHVSTYDTDRPKGPRPRSSRTPNVVHNTAGGLPASHQLQHSHSHSQLAHHTRASAHPLPTPVSARSAEFSTRERRDSRHERRRSPTDPSRPSSSRSMHVPHLGRVHPFHNEFPSHSARASGVFSHSPNTSQPHRQSAFYVNIPGEPGESALSGLASARPVERSPDSATLPVGYGRYSEDVYHGRIQGYPDCPRQYFSTDFQDWRVLTPFNDFYVCPTCYEAAFARSIYAGEFAPAPLYNPDERIRCTFGSMHWYRVALFINNKLNFPTLNLLRTLFERDEQLRMGCSGIHAVLDNWFTIDDPATGMPIPKFTVCEQCSNAVKVLFPKLKNIFRQRDPHGYDVMGVCSMYYELDRRRLWRYIDAFETANDLAISAGAPPDIKALVEHLTDINKHEECMKDILLEGRKWYWMRSLPYFTVCKECFDEFVLPKVNAYRSIAGDFFKEAKELPMAACHLYSPRMREIFVKACQTNDKAYLERKLEERRRIADNIATRIENLPRVPALMARGDPERKKLVAEWRKWE